MSHTETLEEFYRLKFGRTPKGVQLDNGHFNVFDLAETSRRGKPTVSLRRDFYKIMLIRGNFSFRCADKIHEVNGTALGFVNPDVPYKLERPSSSVSGYFCIIKEGFFSEHLRSKLIDLPVFSPQACAPYMLNKKQERLFGNIFVKIRKEITTDYPFKYDLIRSYVTELIYQAMKLEPTEKLSRYANANDRITALFRDLLERQFPINSNAQQLQLRTATQFAAQLHIHVNHLNRSVRVTTGKTTTSLIMERLLSEAKALLTHTDWNVADIGYCLGFDEIANFNHFFKKHTTVTPTIYRQHQVPISITQTTLSSL